MNTAAWSQANAQPAGERAASTALWVLIGVGSMLFALFLLAYAMRMDAYDWSPIAVPPQLWLSTALLLAASGLMQMAADATQRQTRRLMWGGGLAAALFLASQLWAWHAQREAGVGLAGNPAASFFYVLTALHGLHVLGGLLAWAWAAQCLAPTTAGPGAPTWRIRICARYWHFLFGVWALLFAALAGLTPEMVRALCGTG